MRHSLRRLIRRILTLLIFTAPMWGGTCVAMAAESTEPCRPVVGGVLCTDPAFTGLMDLMADADADLAIATARLEDCRVSNAELKKKLDEALARPPVIVREEPKALAPSLGYSLMLSGLLAGAAGPFVSEAPTSLRLSLGIGSALAAGLGVLLALPR